jgi:hypothetical protein
VQIHHEFSQSHRLSPRNGFTVCFVLSPVSGVFCHRCRSRTGGADRRHGRGARTTRLRRTLRAFRLAGEPALAPQRPSQPAPRFVTTAKRPSWRRGLSGPVPLICPTRQGNILIFSSQLRENGIHPSFPGRATLLRLLRKLRRAWSLPKRSREGGSESPESHLVCFRLGDRDAVGITEDEAHDCLTRRFAQRASSVDLRQRPTLRAPQSLCGQEKGSLSCSDIFSLLLQHSFCSPPL